MESWPVSMHSIHHLKDLFETHDICPLPAFNTNRCLIPSSQYDSSLRGAMAKVHFTVTHHFIKKNKCHVYMTLLHRLQVLCGPDMVPSSPFKCVHVSMASPGHKSHA
ncbi:hypothetical protein J3R82DRAFT_1835 [Butyriboletus roseoflavus]|nr:hypothetical protein J3R82DRAFT_1835 [Butyriboletus roseoflavus]